MNTTAFLVGLKRRGVHLGLERMRGFCAALGNPQVRVPVIHVTGTNGKGSVAAMLESVLRHAGWRTGLYTSPHLVKLGERIQVNRTLLPDAELAALVRELAPVVDRCVAAAGPGAKPSYFEFMTALAFVRFVRAECDIAVVEVGMGGRLDATNVVLPEVSVVTSIGMDHAEFLGSTLTAIAGEKAGIIKPRRPVVIGRVPHEAERVLRAVAVDQDAPVWTVTEAFGNDIAAYPATNLSGEYQRLNAATAVLAARQLGPKWRITPEVIAAGLASVDWPARWQPLDVGGRTVILDAAHNAEGAEALDHALAQLAQQTGRAPVVVVGVLGASRAKPVLEAVCRHAAAVHLVVPRQSRACSHDELASLVPASFRGEVVRTSVDAVFPLPDVCLPDTPRDVPVVVAGSIYLAGEVLVRIDPGRGPLESNLQDF